MPTVSSAAGLTLISLLTDFLKWCKICYCVVKKFTWTIHDYVFQHFSFCNFFVNFEHFSICTINSCKYFAQHLQKCQNCLTAKKFVTADDKFQWGISLSMGKLMDVGETVECLWHLWGYTHAKHQCQLLRGSIGIYCLVETGCGFSKNISHVVMAFSSGGINQNVFKTPY